VVPGSQVSVGGSSSSVGLAAGMFGPVGALVATVVEQARHASAFGAPPALARRRFTS